MKTCLICTSSSDDTAPTCIACGEASWGVQTVDAPTVDTKADETDPDALKTDEVVTTDEVITVVDNPAPAKKRTKKQ